MKTNAARYRVQYVGGGHDLFVVFDSNMGSHASVHSTHNCVKRFRDNMEGLGKAETEADKRNAAAADGPPKCKARLRKTYGAALM